MISLGFVRGKFYVLLYRIILEKQLTNFFACVIIKMYFD